LYVRERVWRRRDREGLREGTLEEWALPRSFVRCCLGVVRRGKRGRVNPNGREDRGETGKGEGGGERTFLGKFKGLGVRSCERRGGGREEEAERRDFRRGEEGEMETRDNEAQT